MKKLVLKKVVSHDTLSSDPVINHILQNRGVTQAQLDRSLSNLLHPNTMKGMNAAVNLLAKHLDQQSRVIIITDFDCDGCTGNNVAVKGLEMLGFNDVRFLVPDRFKHGYGLQPGIAEIAGKSHPQLIITVDNGISSVDGAKAVKALPCDLLITDHHLAPERLPIADAIVNPNQPGCEFKSKAIAGCGVIFYVLLALRAFLRERGDYQAIPEPPVHNLIDYVAFGTIADVVALDYNNRLLIHAGLERIRRGAGHVGLNALFAASDIPLHKVDPAAIGFFAAPRLNAAGRLTDMTHGIRCLLSDNYSQALELAKGLSLLNDERKSIEQNMLDKALAQIDSLDDVGYGVVLFNKSWHEGVVGILASRIKDRLNRPVICFTITRDGKMKGSGRSVKGVHLRDVIVEVGALCPALIIRAGGHAMSAGLEITQNDDSLTLFRKTFDQQVRKSLTEDMLAGSISCDLDLPAQAINFDLAEKIKANGPWGQAFEEPIFRGRFLIRSLKVLKDKHLKLKLSPWNEPTQMTIDGIAFGCVENGVVPVEKAIECAYHLDINEFRGRETLQLRIAHLHEIV